MFSVRQKREIADKVQKVLRETNHDELPDGEINFLLHVDGAEAWSWAEIRNNSDKLKPGPMPFNTSVGERVERPNAELLEGIRQIEARQMQADWEKFQKRKFGKKGRNARKELR